MPDFKAYVRQNLPPMGVPPAREAEIVEELALELEERYERGLRAGLASEEAWQEARKHASSWREIGDELRSALQTPDPPAPEPPRPARRFGLFPEGWWRDIRFALKQARSAPGFTLIAILMLALGIGANTAIFSLMNAILLRPLPVRQPDQLVFFGKTMREGNTGFLPNGDTDVFSYPFFQEFNRRNQAFAGVAAIQSFLTPSYARMPGQADPEAMRVELVSGTYFHTLGVDAVKGRTFSSEDDAAPGTRPFAVVSYAWWRDHFGKDTTPSNQTFTIGSTVYSIIGVAPAGFMGVTVGRAPDVWIPLSMQKQVQPDRNGLEQNLYQCLHIIARLKPGVGAEQAQVQTNVLFREILKSFVGPEASQEKLNQIQHASIRLTPAATGRSWVRLEFTQPLRVLMVVVGLVLLIACANVANLLLTRGATRQKELAVRMAMGAERVRLIRQLLVESALLAGAGAILGIAFAWGASRLLLAMVSAGSTLLPLRVTPDAGVLAFTVAVTVLTVFLFGAGPAFRATRLDLAHSLKAGRGLTSIALRKQFANALVGGQVALSLVLLAAAALFLRSVTNLSNVDVGFDRHNALRLRIDASAAGYHTDARLGSMMQRLEDRVSAVPGVLGASFALSAFDGGGWSEDDIHVPGRAVSAADESVCLNVVGRRYLDVMKMPILLGRNLNERDQDGSRQVAVINETMARTYFEGGSPLGHTFSVGDMAEYQNVEVVGVVKDAKYMVLEEAQRSAAFFPLAQHHTRFYSTFIVRYSGDPAMLMPAIRRSIREVDANLPVGGVRKLSDLVDDFTLDRRLVAQLSSFFGILAVLLTCIGVYGVTAYRVTRRANEFGIRMALGARPGNVLWVVLRETFWLALAGSGLGVALALASGRLVQSLLFGVQSANAAVLGSAMLLIVAVSLLAGYLPARRAIQVDPSAALRSD